MLSEHLKNIVTCGQQGPILDLACGNGRNGLYLIENGIPVVFADIKQGALDKIQYTLELEQYKQNKHLASLWCIDFERDDIQPLHEAEYDGILVFRYLHRPLIPHIKQAIKPGGVVIYETFTTDQPQFGRPTNPRFLLQAGELLELFSDWKILHHFEGVVEDKMALKHQAIAQIVAIKC